MGHFAQRWEANILLAVYKVRPDHRPRDLQWDYVRKVSLLQVAPRAEGGPGMA